MKKAIFASVALLALTAMAPANAGVLFSDNFDGEGTPAADDLQYNGFSKWNVTGGVDLVYTPNPWGITCSGKCVDLDGTPGPGSMTTKNSIAFVAGQLVTISFDMSGSQRSSDSDDWNLSVDFDALNDFYDFSSTGFVPAFPTGDFFGFSNITGYHTSGGNDPFASFSLSFTPGQSGAFTLTFTTDSADNQGSLLDNVLVTQGNAVPEPATWAMMIGGFALAGAAMRRRKAVVSFA